MNTHQDRAPQDKVCGYEYTVRRGDSFYLIANRLGVPLRDLLEANSDINPARLMVGDVLCIPLEEDDAPPAQEPSVPPEEPPVEEPPETPLPDEDLDVPAVDEEAIPCPGGTRYTLREGETVADVQLHANVNRYSLQSANPSADLEALHAGQTLCIPQENIACPKPATYTLHTDDTLESTALRLNVSLAALLRANPCLAPSDFTAGQCIFIPE